MSIGLQSLMTYQTALDVTSQNISNADTPYYSRHMIDFRELANYHGVDIANITRIFDSTADHYSQLTKSNFSQYDTYLQQLKNLEPFFDNANTSVGTFISSSLTALQQLNSNTSIASNRNLYLNSLSNLANQFQSASTNVAGEMQNVNSSLQGVITQANNILNSLANVNSAIVSGGKGNDIDSLLDQQQSLLQELSQYFNFTTQTDSTGAVYVSLSNGLTLLNGTQAQQITTTPDPNNAQNLLPAVTIGSTNVAIDNYIQSGKITGLLDYRQNALIPTQRALDRLAMVFAQALNTQNKLGVDANGNLGGNIFNDINSTAAINNRFSSNSNNTGTCGMTVSITNVNALPTSTYQLVIGAANAYTLTRTDDNGVQTVVGTGTIAGPLPQTISVASDGFSFTINSGTFNSGDEYTISPTKGGVNNLALTISDPASLALGWPVTASVGTQNQGSTGQITVTNITDTTNAAFATPKQLSPPLLIQFTSPTTYSIINANTSAVIQAGISYTPGVGQTPIFPTPAPTSYDPGYRVSLSGTMQTGDTFNIDYNNGVGSDNRNGQAIASLYQQNLVAVSSGQSVTFNNGYNALAGNISTLANSAQSGYDSSKSIKESAEQIRDSISGVSLQEETMNLARFQQAYEASAQILQSARAVFETVSELLRG